MHLSKATFEVLCSGRSKTSQLCLSGPHPILCSQRRQVAAEKILSWLAGVVKHKRLVFPYLCVVQVMKDLDGTGKDIPSGEAGI